MMNLVLLITGYIKDGFGWIVIQLFLLVDYIARAIAGLFNDLLVFVMSDDFVVWPYTTTDNPVIDAGLSVTVSLVNIIIIFALVVIAGGIMFGLEKYGTKKMLFYLILIALLVNFAPLIVGVIVDAANIAMFFFVEEAERSMRSAGDALRGTTDSHGGINLKKAGGDDVVSQSVMAQLTVISMQIFVSLVMAFIFFLFTLLFIFRYIAIWMLTILSPIAFASLAHPLLQGWWRAWWSQLISWSFVGTIGAFFLWLSLEVNDRVIQEYQAMNIETHDGFFAGIASYTFPMIVVAAFFVMSFILTIKTSAMGADKIVNFAENRRKWMQGQAARAPKWAGRKTKEKGKQAGRAAVSTVASGSMKQKFEEMSQAEGKRNWGTRRLGRMGSGAIEKNEKARHEEAKERHKDSTNTQLKSKLKDARTMADEEAIEQILHEKGDIEGLPEIEKEKFDRRREYAKSIGAEKDFNQRHAYQATEKGLDEVDKKVDEKYARGGYVTDADSSKEEKRDAERRRERNKVANKFASSVENLEKFAKTMSRKAVEGEGKEKERAQSLILKGIQINSEGLNKIIQKGGDYGTTAVNQTFLDNYNENQTKYDPKNDAQKRWVAMQQHLSDKQKNRVADSTFIDHEEAPKKQAGFTGFNRSWRKT